MIAGFQRASGNFVGFLDSDDAWAPDYIRAHLSAHLNPDFCAGMSCCDMMIIDHSSRLLTSTWKEMKKDRGSPAGESRSRLRPTCDEILDAKPPTFNPARDTISYERQSGRAAWMFSPTSACVYRSDLLGLMLPKSGSHFRISADYYLSMQASVLTGCLFIEAALAYYRVHGKNGFSIHPVVGGNWRPGIWDRENSRNYNRRIVEHIQSEVDAYVSVFGSHEVKAALEMFGEESASAAEPLRFASKTPKRRKTRFWKNMRRISRNAIGSK
jgi:glycosyltransferase involved in cell wall biosynthesis